jgi:hypothetical protein
MEEKGREVKGWKERQGEQRNKREMYEVGLSYINLN